jgi:hypothetical protein
MLFAVALCFLIPSGAKGPERLRLQEVRQLTLRDDLQKATNQGTVPAVLSHTATYLRETQQADITPYRL